MSEKRADRGPWLIMLYLAGDNSLTEDMVLALQDLLAVGPPGRDRIVAQFDPSGEGLFTQRYDFRGATGKPLEHYRDKTYAGVESNTGSVEALVDFVRWAHGKYPRMRKHFLILSGHGSGTTEDFLLKDETSRDSLTIPELKEALRQATAILGSKKSRRKIDLLGMDACSMSMGEVAHEIADDVGIMVGAEGLEPEFGWPYGRILTKVQQFGDEQPGKHMTAEELARTIVEEYVDHYSDYDRSAGRSADLAALELEKMKGVKDAFSELVSALRRLDEAAGHGPNGDADRKALHNKVLLAHWYAQTYKYEQFVDLKDLCGQLEERLPEVRNECGKVAAAVEKCVVKSGCSGFAFQHSHGLSIYFPWAYVSSDYLNVSFGRTTRKGGTGWLGFLRTHLVQTRREARFGAAPMPGGRAPFRRLAGWFLGVDPEGCRDERAAALQARLARSQGRIRRAAEADETEGMLRALGRLVKAGEVTREAIDTALTRIAEADIPEEDVPRELARRIMPRSLAARRSRHSNGTRHSDGTRFPFDREAAVKNLPLVIGKQLWTRREPRD